MPETALSDRAIDPNSSRAMRTALIGAGTHTVVPLVVVVMLTFFVPRIMMAWAENARSIPALTSVTLHASDSIKTHWPVIIGAVLFPLLIIDVFAGYALACREGTMPFRVYNGCVLAAELLVFLWLVISILAPYKTG